MTLAAADVRRIYKSFHSHVGKLIRRAQRSRKVLRSLTSIIFSDSLYMFFESVEEAVTFSLIAMQTMLRNRLPIRIGVGWGTADRLNFSSDMLPTGDVVLSAPFLGTGVVNAYKAESCGVRGMRILVDSSVSYLLEKAFPDLLLRLPKSEATQNVKHEINYLASDDQGESATLFIKKVKEMRDHAPEDKRTIYGTTLRALARMSQANSPRARRQRELRRLEKERQNAVMWKVTLKQIEKQLGRRGRSRLERVRRVKEAS